MEMDVTDAVDACPGSRSGTPVYLETVYQSHALIMCSSTSECDVYPMQIHRMCLVPLQGPR